MTLSMILKRVCLTPVIAVAVLLVATGGTFAQTTQSPLPPPTGYVNDYAKVIDSATKNRLETTLSNLDREQQIQFVVVTVDTTKGQEIFDYSLAVARGWGIGAKDTSKPSLLLLAAIQDRKAFTQISRHLEGELPDGLAGQIQRERAVPAFRRGDYGQGLADTINTYIVTVAEKRGFSTDKIFAPGQTAPRRRTGQTNTCTGPLVIVAIVAIILIVLFVIRRRGGRGGFGGGYGGGDGWMNALILSMLLNSGRRSGSSGWSGGGFGDSGGGGGDFGGGGFGGFGGGGDFGGGGAGVDW
jgi:uncharacterized protein